VHIRSWVRPRASSLLRSLQ